MKGKGFCMREDKFLSVVIPIYNSQNTIAKLIQEIVESINNIELVKAHEIVLINDESKDDSLKEAKMLQKIYPQIKIIDFSKNFGQHNAIIAGLKYTVGDLIICMDDDLQTPAFEISKLLDELIQNNFDVVYAEYKDKKHSSFRKFGSHFNDMMAKWFINEPKHIKATSFFVTRKFVIDEVVKYENPYPYLSGLIFRVTQNIGSVEVEHQERLIGKSNYTLGKLVKLWLNGFTNFSIKPLRVASFAGLVLAVVTFIISIILLIQKLIIPDLQLGWTSIMIAIFFLGGVQLVSIGLLGEYVGRIYLSINKSPQYVIKDLYLGENDD